MSGELDREAAEDAARDYLRDLLAPTGVDDPDSVAAALVSAGLTLTASPEPMTTERGVVNWEGKQWRWVHAADGADLSLNEYEPAEPGYLVPMEDR